MSDSQIEEVKKINLDVSFGKSDIENFIREYRIGKLIRFQKIKKGLANNVVDLQTTGGRYILKIVVRNNPKNRVRYEVDLLNHLRGMPVPSPVKTTKNEYLALFNKRNKAFVYPFLPGWPVKFFSEDMLKQVGKFLGKMHRQTRGFKAPVRRIKLYQISPRDLRVIMPACQRIKDRAVARWLPYLEKGVDAYRLPAPLPQGAMHMDLKPENTLFTGHKLTGVVDFDNSYNGPFVLDLANTMMWFCTQPAKFDANKAEIICKAYQKERPLSKKEKTNLVKALHFAFVSHVLIDIFFFAYGKLPARYIKWVLANLLETENKLYIIHFKL